MVNFTGPEELKNIYNYTVEKIDEFYNTGISICFAGNHGVGKTSAATNILKFVCQKNYSATYTTLSDIISSLIDAPFDEKYYAKKQLVSVDFLVIDEFDPRHIGSGLSADLFGKTLDNIFRTRSQNKLPTIFCTNSPNPADAFDNAIKQSIISLMAKVKVISVIGKDHRKP